MERELKRGWDAALGGDSPSLGRRGTGPGQEAGTLREPIFGERLAGER